MSDSELTGYVDECTWDLLRGWARRADRPQERLTLELLVDGQVVQTTRADLPGEDLERAGIGDGRYRFSVDLGNVDALRNGDIHDVQLRDVDSRWTLPSVRLTRWSAGSLEGEPLVDILAARYLSGVGLEIGALHRPQKLPAGARVRHVDRLSTPELKQLYGEVPADDIVTVEIVDDGATLSTVPDFAADFLIANNVLEHVEDPIATLANWHRVVRPGGIVLLVVPNPRNSADALRTHTTAAHVIDDHVNGVLGSRASHYREWVTHVERRPTNEVKARTAQLMGESYPIHFHVWDELGCALLLHAMMETTRRRFLIEHLALTADRIDTVLALRVA